MANLTFGEWIWDYASQSKEIMDHLLAELTRDDWLFRQPYKLQLQILEGAPEEEIDKIAGRLKPEAAIALGYNPFMSRR